MDHVLGAIGALGAPCSPSSPNSPVYPECTMMQGSSQPRKRQRRTHACEECRYRKVKCSQEKPSCAQCVAYGAVCEYREPAPRRDKIDRTIAVSYTDQQPSLSKTSPVSGTQNFPGEAHSPGTVEKVHATVSKTRLQSNGHWNAFAKVKSNHPVLAPNGAVQDGVFHLTSKGPADSTGEVMACKQLGRLVKRARPSRKPLPDDLADQIPDSALVDQLINLYFETTETCFRVLHHQSFMFEYLKYKDGIANAPSWLILQLLLVMSIAGPMHPNTAVRESISANTHKWIHTAHTWLSAPLEKDRLKLEWIQVHCLLLIARMATCYGADLVWISAGSLVRMAVQMGLNQDPDSLRELQNLDNITKDIRRYLWFTILELDLQASVDSGMMPTKENYTTRPLLSLPEDIECTTQGEEHTSYPQRIQSPIHSGSQGQTDPKAIEIDDSFKGFPLEMHQCDESSMQPNKVPEVSFQGILASSIGARASALEAIYKLQEEPDHKNILSVDDKLVQHWKAIKCSMDREISQNGESQTIQFAYNLCSHIFLRSRLCLHFPFAMTSPDNHLFAHSQKACLDVALELVTLLEDERYNRLMISGGGMFRDILTRGGVMIFLELFPKLTPEMSLVRRSRVRQQSLWLDAERVVKYAKDRILNGEIGVKGYVFLSIMMARCEAQIEGKPIDDAADEASKESLQICRDMLEKRAGGLQLQNPFLVSGSSATDIDHELELGLFDFDHLRSEDFMQSWDLMSDWRFMQ